MAKKERQKRSARKARQKERAEREALQAASASSSKAGAKSGATVAKAEAPKKKDNKPAKAEKDKKSGRVSTYFREVRSEMRRVSWPGKAELRNYSVAVIVSLIVTGVVIWLVDLGFVNLFNLYTNLRG